MKIHRTILVLALGSSSLVPFAAFARSDSCTDSYEKAQEEKASGRLRAALGHLKQCIDPFCLRFIRDDCTRRIDETEAPMPSLVSKMPLAPSSTMPLPSALYPGPRATEPSCRPQPPSDLSPMLVAAQRAWRESQLRPMERARLGGFRRALRAHRGL